MAPVKEKSISAVHACLDNVRNGPTSHTAATALQGHSHHVFGLHRWYRLRYREKGFSMDKAIENYSIGGE